MDRRDFCKTFFVLPLFASSYGLSKHSKRVFELQLIASSPHQLILPILEEVQNTHFLWGKDFTTVNHHPQKEDLIGILSKNHWKYVQKPSQADLIFKFCHLLKPAPPSFALIKNETVYDIRSKNLFSLWQEMNKTHNPSSLLTIISFNNKGLKLIQGTSASIYIDGEKVKSLSLKKSYSKSFTTKRGRVDVLIEKQKARVVNSSCFQKICLHTSPISLEGERIICAPNHFLLEIDSYNSVDTIIG